MSNHVSTFSLVFSLLSIGSASSGHSTHAAHATHRSLQNGVGNANVELVSYAIPADLGCIKSMTLNDDHYAAILLHPCAQSRGENGAQTSDSREGHASPCDRDSAVDQTPGVQSLPSSLLILVDFQTEFAVFVEHVTEEPTDVILTRCFNMDMAYVRTKSKVFAFLLFYNDNMIVPVVGLN